MEGMRILPAGDKALVVEFGKDIDEETNRRVHALCAYLKARHIRGVRETLPTFRSLMVFYDSEKITFARLGKLISRFQPPKEQAKEAERRTLLVPCCYGGAYGPDLEEMAGFLKMDTAELIRIHEHTDYKIYMLGFLPGFVYLGGLDERIHMPRLSAPRTKIPARSVGIGGNQTGVYPVDSPGGWRLIGSTPLDFYHSGRERPVLCRAGEYIRFVPIGEKEYQALRRDEEAGILKPEYI